MLGMNILDLKRKFQNHVLREGDSGGAGNDSSAAATHDAGSDPGAAAAAGLGSDPGAPAAPAAPMGPIGSEYNNPVTPGQDQSQIDNMRTYGTTDPSIMQRLGIMPGVSSDSFFNNETPAQRDDRMGLVQDGVGALTSAITSFAPGVGQIKALMGAFQNPGQSAAGFAGSWAGSALASALHMPALASTLSGAISGSVGSPDGVQGAVDGTQTGVNSMVTSAATSAIAKTLGMTPAQVGALGKLTGITSAANAGLRSGEGALSQAINH